MRDNQQIFLISLGILILGGGITIWQARNAVRNELDWTPLLG